MSISKKIIYGSNNEVVSFLKSLPKLDVIDEYGYTPLIQTAIVNSITKAKTLLNAGAKIDFTDLTGRTALFWAADNGNLELCKLFLKHGADPNAYSSGGQPLVVMPLIKNNHDVKRLLISSGAKLDFAHDFLNAKTLGHIFELEGRVDIVDTHNTFIEIELEGFYLRFTLEIITNSLIEFRNNFGAKKLRPYFLHLDKIIQALQISVELLQFQHYLIDIEVYLKRINSLLQHQPLILPISFGGHAIALIKYYDLFIRCDRGEYGKEHGSVVYCQMQYPTRFSNSLCRDLLYKRQYVEYINVGLFDYLGLRFDDSLGLSLQKTGNCSWANIEAIIPTLMFLYLRESNSVDIAGCKQEAIDFYQEWSGWNKARSLEFCLQSIHKTTTSRAATKTALLAAILFQSCQYDNPNDRVNADKIISILSKPEYIYVLKCYTKAYGQDPKNILWNSFLNYLEDFGIDLDRLTTISP